MIRTQISFDEKAYRAAKRAAREQRISLAEFCRRAIAQALETSRSGDGEKPWMKHAGTISLDDPAASQTVDEVVYGRARP